MILEILIFGIIILGIHFITHARFELSKETEQMVSFLQNYCSKQDLMLRICCYNYACNRPQNRYTRSCDKEDTKAYHFLQQKLTEYAKIQEKGV